MCYSIYLMHMLIFSGLFTFTHRLITHRSLGWDYIVQLVVMVPIVVAVSALYFFFIERPCMDPEWPGKAWSWLRRRTSSMPQPRTGEAV
jgi:peptidoglycan/LPS O-acetylase OafA/YrhL